MATAPCSSCDRRSHPLAKLGTCRRCLLLAAGGATAGWGAVAVPPGSAPSAIRVALVVAAGAFTLLAAAHVATLVGRAAVAGARSARAGRPPEPATPDATVGAGSAAGGGTAAPAIPTRRWVLRQGLLAVGAALVAVVFRNSLPSFAQVEADGSHCSCRNEIQGLGFASCPNPTGKKNEKYLKKCPDKKGKERDVCFQIIRHVEGCQTTVTPPGTGPGQEQPRCPGGCTISRTYEWTIGPTPGAGLPFVPGPVAGVTPNDATRDEPVFQVCVADADFTVQVTRTVVCRCGVEGETPATCRDTKRRAITCKKGKCETAGPTT